MLRDLFVIGVILVGIVSCLKGPFNALLFYLWLAYFRPEQWIWVDWISATHLSLIVGCLTVVLTIFSPASAKVKVTWTTTLLMLFLVHSWTSAVFSRDFAWSMSWWPDFFKVLLIGYLISLHVTDTHRLRLVALVIALALGFEAAKQGWAQLIVNPTGVNANTHPVLGDNNGVALGMFMLAPIVGALASTARGRLERTAHRFVMVGLVLRGLTTWSRGGFVAAGGLAVMMALHSQHRVRAIVLTALVSIAALAAMPPKFWERMRTITVSEEQRDESAASRLYFWRVAVRMATDHPVAGIGFNAFTRAYDAYDVTDRSYGRERAVHSSWFGALAEMGIPGLLLLVAVVLHSVRTCRSIGRRPPDTDDARVAIAFAHALEASFVVYIIAGSFVHAQYSEMVWHFVSLVGALRFTLAAQAATALAAPADAPVSIGFSKSVVAMTDLS